jgi:hypothetical protein
MMPEKLSDINTNLSHDDLVEIAAALDDKEVDWEDENCSLNGPDCIAFFTYDGKRYRLFEHFETVISINVIDFLSAMPTI